MANFIVIPIEGQDPAYLNVDLISTFFLTPGDGLIIPVFSPVAPDSGYLYISITNGEQWTIEEATALAFEAIKKAIAARPGGSFVQVLFPDGVTCSSVSFPS